MSGKAVSQIPLPKGWLTSVQSAVLQVIALAQFAMTHVRGWAADSVNTRVRLKAELDQVNQDNPPRYGAVGARVPQMVLWEAHPSHYFFPIQNTYCCPTRYRRPPAAAGDGWLPS
jgi:hypothetical protein